MKTNSPDSTNEVDKVMDLVDELGNTIDQMVYAVQEGDLERIKWLEPLGIDPTDERFIHCAVDNDQLLVVAYQISKGADINRLIEIALEYDKQVIWQWAKCWKSVSARKNGMIHYVQNKVRL